MQFGSSNTFEIVLLVVALVFLTALPTLTVSRSRLFKPVRAWLREVTASEDGERVLFVDLIECPFCLSFWVALAVCIFLPLETAQIAAKLPSTDFVAFLMVWAMLWGLSNMVIVTVLRLYEDEVYSG